MFPSSPNFSRDITKLMALASLTAYEDAARAEEICRCHGATGFDFIEDKATDTQLFIATRDDIAVVAFRGSSSFQDFVADAKMRRRDWRGLSVHRGFADAYESVRLQIRSALRQSTVYFTGHSLGAALATLCAYDFSGHVVNPPMEDNMEEKDFGVYLFGSPRVGDAKFAMAYDAALRGRTFRFVNETDPVCRLPFWIPHLTLSARKFLTFQSGYRHVGTEIFLDSFGEFQTDVPFLSKIPSAIYGLSQGFDPVLPGISEVASVPKHHFMGNYIFRLEKIGS